MPAASRPRGEVLPVPRRSRGADRQVPCGAQSAAAAVQDSAAGGLTILVMASHPARTTRMILEEWGHAVTVAGSIRIPAAAEWRKADLLLVESAAPGSGALTAVEAVRDTESKTGGHIPVIAVAVHAGSGNLAACREAGADGCVSAPLDPGALNSEIDRLGPVVARWRLTRACLDPAAWSLGWQPCAKPGDDVWGARRVHHGLASPGT